MSASRARSPVADEVGGHDPTSALRRAPWWLATAANQSRLTLATAQWGLGTPGRVSSMANIRPQRTWKEKGGQLVRVVALLMFPALYRSLNLRDYASCQLGYVFDICQLLLVTIRTEFHFSGLTYGAIPLDRGSHRQGPGGHVSGQPAMTICTESRSASTHRAVARFMRAAWYIG